MTIPSFKSFLRPTLEIIASLKEVPRSNIVQLVQEKMHFNEEESNERLESGQNRLQNRVGWAITYLKKSGLIDFPKKGLIIVSNEGQKFLKEHIGAISPKDLEKFPGYLEFIASKNQADSKEAASVQIDEVDPEEKINMGYQEIKNTLIEELREKLLEVSPLKFEELVLDLIRSLGYGAKSGDIHHTGGSGDFGIDGIVYLDRLGLDKIYLQAKRYKLDSKISSTEIQKFFGALKGRQASKGIFLTTSSYQNSAKEYAKSVSDTLVLLDGSKIAELMIEAEVGVSFKRKIVIPVIDNDYFEE
jgi:restriction system protein